MAQIQQQLVITADPLQPVAEINNIISGFLKLYPGRETEILKAVDQEIQKAIVQFEKIEEPKAAKEE